MSSLGFIASFPTRLPVFLHIISISDWLAVIEADPRKLSAAATYNRCDVVFRAYVDLQQWEARAVRAGTSPGPGVGILIGSGGNLAKQIDANFAFLSSALYQGDGAYRISIFGQDATGQWGGDGQ